MSALLCVMAKNRTILKFQWQALCCLEHLSNYHTTLMVLAGTMETLPREGFCCSLARCTASRM